MACGSDLMFNLYPRHPPCRLPSIMFSIYFQFPCEGLLCLLISLVLIPYLILKRLIDVTISSPTIMCFQPNFKNKLCILFLNALYSFVFLIQCPIFLTFLRLHGKHLLGTAVTWFIMNMESTTSFSFKETCVIS